MWQPIPQKTTRLRKLAVPFQYLRPLPDQHPRSDLLLVFLLLLHPPSVDFLQQGSLLVQRNLRQPLHPAQPQQNHRRLTARTQLLHTVEEPCTITARARWGAGTLSLRAHPEHLLLCSFVQLQDFPVLFPHARHELARVGSVRVVRIMNGLPRNERRLQHAP
jgi:hypothetical protein